jgi:hypothetical protein
MTDVQPILDYASPRPRGRVRLPARSTLDVRTDPDSVEVIERLDGHGEAIGGILFAAMTLILMTVVIQPELRYAMRRGPTLPLTLAAACIVGGVVVTAMVINNTWRRTVLSANADGVRLRFFAPLSGSRRYAWEADRIEGVGVVTNDPNIAAAEMELSRSRVLAELQIHPVAGAIAHLFSDHEAFQLVPIKDALLRVLRMSTKPPSPTLAPAVLR